MLPLYFYLSALAAPLSVSAQVRQAQVPNPTLFFNVSLSLPALVGLGIDSWNVTYANTQGKGPDTIAEGPAKIQAMYTGPHLSIFEATKEVYIYGELGSVDTGRFTSLNLPNPENFDDSLNKVSNTKGLIGTANYDMFKSIQSEYPAVWLYFTGGMPRLDEVIVTTGIETNATSFSEVNVTTLRFIEDGKLNPRFSWDNSSAAWHTTSSYAAALNDSNLRLLAERSEAAIAPTPGVASVSVQTPANTSWVGLNITRGPTFGAIVISSTPKIEGYNPAVYTSTHGPYYSPDEMLWFRSLDPRVPYNITISSKPEKDHPQAFALNSITFYDGNPVERQKSESVAESRSKTNIGAIAGGAVGGVGGALILAGLAWFLLRRRRRRREQELEPRLDLDAPVIPVTPYDAPESSPGQYYDEKGTSFPMTHPREEQQLLTPRRRAVDGGAVPDVEDDVLEPPEYNPQWQANGTPSASQSEEVPPTTSTRASKTTVPPPTTKR